MKRRVVWSTTSRDDVVAVGRYIAQDNPAMARKVVDQLRAAGKALGGMATGHPGRVSGTYEKVVAGLPYIIAYEIVPSAHSEAVAILHVIHGARDWRSEEWPSD